LDIEGLLLFLLEGHDDFLVERLKLINKLIKTKSVISGLVANNILFSD